MNLLIRTLVVTMKWFSIFFAIFFPLYVGALIYFELSREQQDGGINILLALIYAPLLITLGILGSIGCIFFAWFFHIRGKL